MATYTVDTTADTVDAGDGLSLREALALADADITTPDRIEFAPEVQGGTIVLAGSQLTVASDVTIDGGIGVTIDADEKSRVLLVQGDGTDAVLQHLTITGGHTTGNAANDYAVGGGILAGAYTNLTLGQVTVIGNSTAGDGADGGGIFAGASTSLTLGQVTVIGNSAAGDGAEGGGIYTQFNAFLTNSTVSGNTTTGGGAGGGIYGGYISLTNSTVSGNSTNSNGGGIYADAVSLTNSTVSGNIAIGSASNGGGIYGYYAISARNSIVAGNSATNRGPDVGAGGFSVSSNGHNIFGSDVASYAAGDLKNIPARLLFAGGLGDNGGPTQTIALRDAADNPALAGADPADAPPPTSVARRGRSRPALIPILARSN